VITAEQVAERHALARPGYDLVAYREVALPLFRIDVETLVLEEKRIPAIEEFVLRAVEAGLDDLDQVAGLLGVDRLLVRGAAAELMGSGNLVLGAGDAGRHVLKLTAKGTKSAEDAEHLQAREIDLPVYVDGLTRRVLSITGRGLQAFPATAIRRRGLIEITPFPRRKPLLTELPFGEIKLVLGRETAGQSTKQQLIGITGLGATRRFAREAVALAYRSQTDDELVVSVFINGVWSEPHDGAFERAMQSSARRVTPDRWTKADEVAERALPPDVLAQAVSGEETARLHELRSDAARETDELRVAAATAAPDVLNDLRHRLAEAQARERKLLSELEAISVRQVEVYEHRTYLQRAFDEAKSRVLIISPWIKHEVVDGEFLATLRQVLDRGVELWVGYGLDPERPRKGKKGDLDADALSELRNLQRRFDSTFRLHRLGDTHAKVLICDSRFSIVTSFNWLSFKGDKRLHFRDERGMYVGLPEKVDDLFESYRQRFDEPETDATDGSRPAR
jgi:hypothetical protein